MSDADVECSIISTNVRLRSGVVVWESILLDGVTVGDRVRFTAEKLDGLYTVTALAKAP